PTRRARAPPDRQRPRGVASRRGARPLPRPRRTRAPAAAPPGPSVDHSRRAPGARCTRTRARQPPLLRRTRRALRRTLDPPSAVERQDRSAGPSARTPRSAMSMRVEKTEHVTTIILARPESRNAIDGPTAEALSAAFIGFEADDEARVAVLFGDCGTFCAGA